MTAVALDLFSAALNLPEHDRLELASRLIASVDGETEPGWDEAWAAELDKREQAADPGSSWEDVKARISARLGSM